MTAYENTVSLKSGEDREKAEELGEKMAKKSGNEWEKEDLGPAGRRGVSVSDDSELRGEEGREREVLFRTLLKKLVWFSINPYLHETKWSSIPQIFLHVAFNRSHHKSEDESRVDLLSSQSAPLKPSGHRQMKPSARFAKQTPPLAQLTRSHMLSLHSPCGEEKLGGYELKR